MDDNDSISMLSKDDEKEDDYGDIANKENYEVKGVFHQPLVIKENYVQV